MQCIVRSLIVLIGSVLLAVPAGLSQDPASSGVQRGSPELRSQQAQYTVSELRDPHDRIDDRVRIADTILLVSFFNTGRMEVMTHCFMLRDLSSGGITITLQAIHGRSPSLVPTNRIYPEPPSSLMRALRRLPASETYAHDRDANFISWEDAGKWTTRSYDRTRLPREVRLLFTFMKIPDTWL